MDVEAWNIVLGAVYGPDRATGTPDSFDVVLLRTADPDSEISATTEVDGVDVANGYAPGLLDNDDWETPAEGKVTSLPIAFAAPTAAWETPRFVGLRAGGVVWNVRPFADNDPLVVTGPGSAFSIRVTVAAGGAFDG